MMPGWTYTELDQKTTDELQTFVPDRAFDMHAHIYRVADLTEERDGIAA